MHKNYNFLSEEHINNNCFKVFIIKKLIFNDFNFFIKVFINFFYKSIILQIKWIKVL